MKILVVDDDDMVRMMMVQALRSEGYETDECSDGADAIAKLECNTYDIVVTDVVMPNRSGASVGEYVRKNKLPMAVLAVSFDSENGGALEFASYFADGTLQKPYDKATFIKAVKSLSPGTNIDSALQNL